MLILYFSGTGNSRYVAEQFCAQTGCECHSIEERRDFDRLLADHAVVAVCYPVYFSGVPRPLRDFAAHHRAAFRGKQLLILCTQMLCSGDGARAFTDLFPRHWFLVLYAAHFWMPGNLCNRLPAVVYGERVRRWECRRAVRKIQKIRGHLRRQKQVTRGFHSLFRPWGRWRRRRLGRAEQRAQSGVFVNDRCTGCGQCVCLCPVGNLSLCNGRVVPQDRCVLCYRCVNRCPQQALRVVYPQAVVAQYPGPNAGRD